MKIGDKDFKDSTFWCAPIVGWPTQNQNKVLKRINESVKYTKGDVGRFFLLFLSFRLLFSLPFFLQPHTIYGRWSIPASSYR